MNQEENGSEEKIIMNMFVTVSTRVPPKHTRRTPIKGIHETLKFIDKTNKISEFIEIRD